MTRSKLQLVGVAAMLVAAKYEEIYAPEVKDFVYITDRAYTEREILKMEIKILAVLNFDLGRPLPLHFLRFVDTIVYIFVYYLFTSLSSGEPARLVAWRVSLTPWPSTSWS